MEEIVVPVYREIKRFLYLWQLTCRPCSSPYLHPQPSFSDDPFPFTSAITDRIDIKMR